MNFMVNIHRHCDACHNGNDLKLAQAPPVCEVCGRGIRWHYVPYSDGTGVRGLCGTREQGVDRFTNDKPKVSCLKCSHILQADFRRYNAGEKTSLDWSEYHTLPIRVWRTNVDTMYSTAFMKAFPCGPDLVSQQEKDAFKRGWEWRAVYDRGEQI